MRAAILIVETFGVCTGSAPRAGPARIDGEDGRAGKLPFADSLCPARLPESTGNGLVLQPGAAGVSLDLIDPVPQILRVRESFAFREHLAPLAPDEEKRLTILFGEDLVVADMVCQVPCRENGLQGTLFVRIDSARQEHLPAVRDEGEMVIAFA